jgi:hypothetical protein
MARKKVADSVSAAPEPPDDPALAAVARAAADPNLTPAQGLRELTRVMLHYAASDAAMLVKLGPVLSSGMEACAKAMKNSGGASANDSLGDLLDEWKA